MKKQILFLMIIGILCSCNKNDDETNLESGIIGNWKLIQMTGSLINSETTGAEMEWQESYRLNGDGTFQKSRNRDGVITEVSGTYNLINNSNESLLELNFTSESEIVGSCTSNNKEIMNLQSETIFLSSWNACDGPGLKYKKID
ncbi:hypothetical protein FIA58_019000 [Flavobacterium jejuense]|uniref:Lipocalin-like domain-containing protein n=1 Tax=Flavobacterium jejuense TaxID=1544455 RepID=A0ABX0IVN7_9FLAO|nr:hypothetical protein [Flavobacterium jejuense]NHN27773.1 hypothetical protein [Flavobacterium jejuense]